MPSYLGEYKKAAKNRDKKIIRAIRSVCNQRYKDWELIIIADGCEKTVEIVQSIQGIFSEYNVRLFYLDKQPLWSGKVRNAGLNEASGAYSCYLDIDDVFAPGHLQGIADNLNGKDWYWFDDYIWRDDRFVHRKCSVDSIGRCGTSNLIHLTNLARWNEKDNYAHDWNFINNLKAASKNYAYIKAGEYCVSHMPGRFDV